MTKQHHPLQLVIEAAWDAGHTPRILVLGDRARGALPPDVIAAAKSGQIVLDLIPTDPLHPTFTAEHATFDLSFGGRVSRCALPWGSILAAFDRATGEGFVRLMQPPESGLNTDRPKPAVPEKKAAWTPRIVRGGKDPS